MTYGIGPEAMGLGKYSWYLVTEMRKLGISVDVFTTNFHKKGMGAPAFFLRNGFLNLKSYDIVHSNEGAGLVVFHQNMVETYHHYYKQTFNVNSLMFSYLENIQCRKCKQIIVPSFKTKNDLISKEGWRDDRIRVIHHGVDSNLFKTDKSSGMTFREEMRLLDTFVAISVGRLVAHKRHTDIIEALAKVPNSVLILVGAGEEETKIKSKARQFGVKLLHFKNVSDEFLAQLYNASDVYVHSSILEGFGLTILEAMACSLPIVCYDVADLRNIIGDAGHLLYLGDVNGIAKTLISLKDEKHRQTLSQNALKRSKAYTWQKSAIQHLDVYKHILNSV